jgi:hypothetical protein
MALNARRRLVFAILVIAVSTLGSMAALLAIDLLLHKRAERSAGLNMWGYRGPRAGAKRAGEVRIAVLGGSTAFGYGLPWFEAAPAVLERHLNARLGGAHAVSVVNLGFNNEGAYAYRFALDDFRFLDYDVACLFDGYNDMFGDDAPNLAVFRHRSPVFRLTGYYPILPLVFAEKAMAIRSGGNLAAAYAASRGEIAGKTAFQPGLADRASATALESAARITDALGRQLGRLAMPAPSSGAPQAIEGDCAPPWSHYCRSMHAAVTHALTHGARVMVVLQPTLIEPVTERHREQQAALVTMLRQHFGGEPRVHVADLSGTVDLTDRNFSFDGMHLSTDGTERLVGELAGRMGTWLVQSQTP